MEGTLQPRWTPLSRQVFHLLLGSLTLAFGSALTAFVAEVHLVVLKSWFPFWGAASVSRGRAGWHGGHGELSPSALTLLLMNMDVAPPRVALEPQGPTKA